MDEHILNLTEAVIEEIQNKQAYKDLKRYHQRISENPDVQGLSEAFTKAKNDYFEAKKYGDHHPDLLRYQKAFSETKVAMYRHPDVAAFKKAETDVQRLLDEVSVRLAETVSPHVKAATTYGIFNKGGSSCSNG